MLTRKLKTDQKIRLGAAEFVLMLGMVFVSSAMAEECEVPLFVKQTLVGANVMILADNSGSMNAAIYDLAYDHKITYTGTFTSESTYYVAQNKDYAPSDFETGWPDNPSVSLVKSDNGQKGRYSGNYLNWMYYHTTEIQRDNIPTVTRVMVLKEVLNEIINRSARLNFGLTIFQYDHGGNVVGKCGVNPTSLKATINGITANTWTPLGESMETVYDYFAYDGPDAAIQVPCQYNFVLVVTDGLPTMDTEVSARFWDADGDGRDPGNCTSIGAPYDNSLDCSDHFDDIAYEMAHGDLRPDLEGDQVASTYVVGFHENGQLLQDAAVNGDGLFFHAENAIELVNSIEYAIQDILRRISAGSAVAVVSTERGTDDRLYRGKFMPIDWFGYLESYALPYEDGDQAIWEAGELLRQRDMNSRDIFTALGDNAMEFVPGRAEQLYTAMNLPSAAEAETLITWARGNPMPGLRDRKGWILGDIVHSTPVVVGQPTAFVATSDYQAFYDANMYRQKMVYVGANDGMLHAFNADNGHEEWAFVPEFALRDFASLADSGYCHTYTCDQTATVKDVQLNGVWRTVLISGGRQGGSAIFAIDVTDPSQPEVLWQNYLPNGMSYHSEVEIASIEGKSVALVGSGLDEVNGEAWLYVYRLTDGHDLGSIMLSRSKNRNKATTPAVVDINLDGNADIIYMADMVGSLHRIEIGGSLSPGSWEVSELFEGDKHITAAPTVAFGYDGSVYVYFGTGAYLTDDDMMTANDNDFICVIDRHNGSTYRQSHLVNQTSTIHSVTTEPGWYVELWNKEGERVTETAVVVAETVIFTSFAPTLEACVSGGSSYLYQMRYDTGGLANEEDSEAPEDRSVSLGDGIASYPVVDLAQGTVVVQSSDASITVERISSMITPMTVRSWQEQFSQDMYGGETGDPGLQ